MTLELYGNSFEYPNLLMSVFMWRVSFPNIPQIPVLFPLLPLNNSTADHIKKYLHKNTKQISTNEISFID